MKYSFLILVLAFTLLQGWLVVWRLIPNQLPTIWEAMTVGWFMAISLLGICFLVGLFFYI